ncbi:GSU3473 family protein [Syntrophorhabdus aromaticivorans]|uniref:GSU3473 family protein n=1 Tax=Syntrophorhabdus aromaticivorans TaxID=328301 RepID=UPI00048F0A2A|nr:hypothetical protein [Syntrophorhabdus aromaticivorans]
MLLRIQYPDSKYDYVDTPTLDRLIEFRRIRQFFRPSEKKWVDISRDPVRGLGGNYSGPERRLTTL